VFHTSCDPTDTASSHPALHPPPSEDAQFGGAAVLRLKLSSATVARTGFRAWIHARVAAEYVLLCSVRRASMQLVECPLNVYSLLGWGLQAIVLSCNVWGTCFPCRYLCIKSV